jgi:hypothetical protein
MSEQLPAVIDRTVIIGDIRAHVVPALIAAAGERASLRFLEFFAANIRNPHTRRAYSRAVSEFMAWCDDNGVTSITAVQPLHVSAWIEQQTREHAAPTAKLRLAALRHLFDWLVTGQVMPANPAGSVRGPSHVVKAGKTPVLAPEEARALIEQHRNHDAGRLARPGVDRADGVQLRADRRGTRDEGGGRVHAEPPAMGAVAREGRQAAHHAVPPQP